MADLQDSIQALATALASVQATVTGMAASIVEIKTMLSSYVRQDVFDSEQHAIKNRVTANETRFAQYTPLETFQQHVKEADARYTGLQSAQAKVPDVRRQTYALWLSLAALALSAACGAVYVLTDLVTLLQHLTVR